MRRLQKGKRGKPRKKTEPLAEGIRKTKRGRDWASMGYGELVEYARRYFRGKGINGRGELGKADPGLYHALLRRKLLDKIGLDKQYRDWASMSDDEIVGYAYRFAIEREFKGRNELRKADYGLYYVLRKRKLLDRIEFEEGHRDWASMSDEEIVDYACGVVEEKGLKNRHRLTKVDLGLSTVLLRRKLVDRIFPAAQERRPRGFFTKMSDDELVEYAMEVIKEEGIKNKKSLEREDKGLYIILRKRKLLDRVEFEEKRRVWVSVSDEKLVEFARKFIEKKEIRSRHGLQKEDRGLYDVLLYRGLLNCVFAPLESQKKKEAVKQVVDAMKEFDSS